MLLEVQVALSSFKSLHHLSTLYSPLIETDEIRLLVLLPLSRQGFIRCKIIHAKLVDNIRYQALSYMWGSGEPKKAIEIDGFEVPIRINLWEALYYLAPTHSTRVLWIDAICINQESDAERNHQVAQMGRIYSSAETVVVWLGSPTKECQALFQLLGNPHQWSELQNSPTLLKQSLEHLVLLCQREYWTRLWIIQEVILASSIIIQCGADSCQWLRLRWALDTLGMSCDTVTPPSFQDNSLLFKISSSILLRLIRQQNLHRHSWRLSPSSLYNTYRFYPPPTLPEASDWWIKPQLRPLLNVCLQYTEAQCQDQRDKVFGLHNLAADCCRKATPIDYTTQRHQIFASVIDHHIAKKHLIWTHIWRKPQLIMVFEKSGCISREFVEIIRSFHQHMQIPVRSYLYPIEDPTIEEHPETVCDEHRCLFRYGEICRLNFKH